MKILQLGKFYPIRGGVERVMMDLAEGLNTRGIHCDMLCVDDTEASHDFDKKPDFVITTHKLIKVASTTISFKMITKLRKICQQYDLIHIHHPDPMATLALYLSGYKGPVILHWHSDILRQKNLLLLYKPLQKWLLNRATLILGTTPRYIKYSDHLQTVQYKTDYLPIGVDPIEVDSTKILHLREKYKGKKIVFSVGRLVSYKGFEYLIEAAKFLPEDYVVLIGGVGPLEVNLKNLIQSHNLEEKVYLLGYLPEKIKYAYFNLCDVFCLSSTQKTEAYAIVQVEAMSCGKPIVATKIEGSGVPWVNKNEESGLNVEPHNPQSLADGITLICENPGYYNKLCQGATLRYQCFFTKEKMINSVLNIYKNVLA